MKLSFEFMTLCITIYGKKIAVIASRLLARVKDEEGVEKEQKKRNTKTGLEMRGHQKRKREQKEKKQKN